MAVSYCFYYLTELDICQICYIFRSEVMATGTEYGAQ